MLNKPLSEMTVVELKSYMKQYETDNEEWEKAFLFYSQKADWQDLPDDNDEAAKVLEQVIKKKEEI